MRTIVAVFIIALVLAPVLNFAPHTWPGSYAKWMPPETPGEAAYIAWNTDPPPQPNDRWFCLGHPLLCGGNTQ